MAEATEPKTKTKEATQAPAIEKEKLISRVLPAHKSSLLEEGEVLKVLPDGKELLNADEERLAKPLLVTRSEKDPMLGKLHLHRLKLLRDMLKNAKDFETLRQRAKERKELLSKTFSENMANIFREQRPLEKTWREVDVFFKEAQRSPDDTNLDVHFINATFKDNYSELMDPESGLPYWVPKRTKFDMDGMVGLIVVPEWLETEGRIVEVGKLAQEGMSHAFIGFDDCSLEEARKLFEEGEDLFNLKGMQREKQYVSMVGNHLRIRKTNRYEDDSDDGLYISPVMVKAGKVYKGDILEGIHIAQANDPHKIMLPTADNSELKTRWNMRQKDDLGPLNKKLIPVVFRRGLVFWGVETLWDARGNSDEMLWEQYTVKRCDEYISKVVLDFLQGVTFDVNDLQNRDGIRNNLQKFLSKNTGGTEKMLQKGLVTSVEAAGAGDEVDVRVELKYKKAIRHLNLHFKYDEEEQDWKES